MKNKNVRLRNVIIAIILTNVVTASILLGGKFSFAQNNVIVNGTKNDISKQFDKMIKVKQIIEQNYVDKIDKTKEENMGEGAIKGMVDALGDPYTVYMSAKEYKDFSTQTSGSYAGIGIYIGDKDGKIIVVAPIEGSPAEKNGVKSGDAILKVNGIDVTSKEMDKAVSMMLGKPGTSVKVTFYRNGVGNIEKVITRQQIILKRVKAEMLKNKVGYIKITMFDENTSDAFIKALNSLEKQGMKGLIIDLRDNPGGLLEESFKIADALLGKGTIVYTIDNKGEKQVWTSDAKKFDKPLVLLVNGGSASASEILSGAVRDFKAGTLVGTKTFGKGLVQIPVPLSDGSAVKVTIARYYTPSGECIQKKGIIPNVVIDLTKQEKNIQNNVRALKPEEDNQLQKGIEVIKSKF